MAKELAQLMIEHGVGVTVARRYEVKRLDLDYFVTDDEVQAEPDAASAADSPVTDLSS
jgi:hypothetical protein